MVYHAIHNCLDLGGGEPIKLVIDTVFKEYEDV
jgi:hypothetical protein